MPGAESASRNSEALDPRKVGRVERQTCAQHRAAGGKDQSVHTNKYYRINHTACRHDTARRALNIAARETSSDRPRRCLSTAASRPRVICRRCCVLLVLMPPCTRVLGRAAALRHSSVVCAGLLDGSIHSNWWCGTLWASGTRGN